MSLAWRSGRSREAARLCRAVAAEISPEVLAKKDKSPVTVADFGSQALICRALFESFPDDPVIAEEDAAELRSPENRAILDRVVRHVRAVSETATGERVDVGNRAGLRLDRPRREQRVSAIASGHWIQSTERKASSAASSMPSRSL